MSGLVRSKDHIKLPPPRHKLMVGFRDGRAWSGSGGAPLAVTWKRISELALFEQDADGKACKQDQEDKGGDGGEFVVTLFHKDSEHQDHA
jgi:hypothetical protein